MANLVRAREPERSDRRLADLERRMPAIESALVRGVRQAQ
jgi:hypothetical protein